MKAAHRGIPLALKVLYLVWVPSWLRSISLFHMAMPPLLVWSLRRTGYRPAGWMLQTLMILAYPLVLFYPTHLVLRRLLRPVHDA